MRSLLTIGTLTLAAALIGAAPASATYPGMNGLIAYVACPENQCEEPVAGIAAVNPDGSGYHLLVASSSSGSATPAEPAWSPSGQSLAYAVVGILGGIYVANADGSNPRQITSGYDLNPTFSPNGKRVAFDHEGNIFSIKLNGSGSMQISQGGHSTDPNYSPDGKWVAYTRWHRQIWLMRRNGSNQHRLVSGHFPDFSPNGKHVLFQSLRHGPRIVKVDGSRPRDLGLTGVTDPDEPAYSPNGRFIAFTDLATPTTNPIEVVRTNGSGMKQLSEYGFSPAWQALP